MTENGYLEPHPAGLFNKDTLLSHPQDMSSPELEQQVNPGFAQSPVHQVKKPPHSELETSFSDEQGIPTTAKPDLQLNGVTNEYRGGSTPASSLPVNRSLEMPAADQPVSYDNGTVQLPWHYYQYLQQLAAMNSNLNMKHPQNPDLLPASSTSLPSANILPQQSLLPTQTDVAIKSQRNVVQVLSKPPAPKVPENWQAANASQIYEEIPGYKMYSDIPKVPTSSRPNHSPSERSTDSLLKQSPLHRRKENPLYGDNNNSDNTDSVLLNVECTSDSSSTKHRPNSRYRCLCVGFLILLVISCTALTIAMLMAAGVINFQKDTTAQGLTPSSRVDLGKQGNNDLGNQGNNSAQENAVASIQNINKAQTNLSEQAVILQARVQQLELKITNLTSSQSAQQQDLQTLVSRLPSGLIDLSLCEYHSSRKLVDSGSGIERLETLFVPEYSSDGTPPNEVVIASTCSSGNYHSDDLKKKTFENTNLAQYQCVCSGIIDSGSDSTTCAISYWSCPIITS